VDPGQPVSGLQADQAGQAVPIQQLHVHAPQFAIKQELPAVASVIKGDAITVIVAAANLQHGNALALLLLLVAMNIIGKPAGQQRQQNHGQSEASAQPGQEPVATPQNPHAQPQNQQRQCANAHCQTCKLHAENSSQ